ncbi:hypothetical protein Pan153_25610 [Gimesia panareensis]|uniref:Uncharacterized protein n=1 Tax=Gimesia panareensis TaxID=2527978 RepID=A0A518FNR2_9PLAN|nr:DUF6655 family protein [Gimesia panareensis]QDV17905.1 hypothetical protein Pan153_25610 [Gimesia panareensis]
MFDSIRFFDNRISIWLLMLLLPCLSGCGKMISNSATEQLLTSDAVDQTISHIDLSSLSNKKVFFDTSYIKNIKGVGFVNGDYIISSLRQQIVAANCLIQEKKEDADYIIEARVGTLATNGHEVNYGIPASNMLSSAASLMPAAPAIPTIPEISLAKKSNQIAAAKISVFAYNQKTRERVWQSGVLQAKSDARNTWILGAGPFQRGSIYRDGAQFAGSKIEIPLGTGEDFNNAAAVDYLEPAHFVETGDAEEEDLPAAKDRKVKTLAEWIKEESTEKEKQQKKQEAKAEPKKESQAATAKPAESQTTKSAESQSAGNKEKLSLEPAKIKTVLFLKPEEANGHKDWIQGDTSRLSTVWPNAPLAEGVDTKEAPAEEKLELEQMFRKIPAE